MSKEDSSGEGKSQDASTPDIPSKDPNADLYENRKPKKIIRVVTVMAYLFSVSFVGILLSTYYIFLWEPPNPRLMQHERLRTDPQMQFLHALPSEKTDLPKKDSNLLLQNEVNRMHEPFLGRMTHDMFDDPVVDPREKMNLERKRRLNTVLLKLRHSLVDTLRTRNRNLSQEIFSRFNDSSAEVERVLNSTVDAESTISQHGESRGNISEKKTYSDNADLPPEFADSVSMLDVESTSPTSRFTTAPEAETSQIHFDSVTNPIAVEKNRKKKPDAVEFSRDATTNGGATNGSEQRVSGHDSFKMIQEFLKLDRKVPMKRNKTDGRRLVSDHRENYSSDVQTSVILKNPANDSTGNSQENYSNDESSSTDQITRDIVSIDPPSRNLGFTDDPGFRQTPDDPTVIKSNRPRTTGRDSEGERIRAELFLRLCGNKHGRAKRDRVIIQ